MVQCATATVPCCFQEFVATLDRKTGATLEQNPTALQSDEVCIIKLVPARAMCVDVFSHHSALGRVVIRDGRTTVAVGIVLRVETLPCAANPKRSPPKGHGGDLDVAA